MNPAVTVVMPAYNAAATVRSAVLSALAQTRADFELIVVDDGSTDETAEIVSSIRDRRVKLLRQSNAGGSAALNAGIRQAAGRYVATLDSDDLWLPRYLDIMTAKLEEAPEAGVAYADAWILDDVTRRILRKTAMALWKVALPLPTDSRTMLVRLLEGNFVVTSALMRREVLRRVGGYDVRLRRAKDYELWLRIAAHRYQPVFAEEALIVWRRRPGSLSDDRSLVRRSLREMYRIVAEEYPVDENIRSVARRRFVEIEALIAAGNAAAGAPSRPARLVDRLKEPLRRERHLRRRPPREVAAAFPDLRTV